jgi:hypothetical protein
MMAVGACDAYFSDAYGDLISRTLRAKDLQASVVIEGPLKNLRIPVIAVLRQARGGWRWRMAARELVEKENVLSLEKIRDLFNQFFRPGHKLLNPDTIGDWIVNPAARSRFFGLTAAQFRALRGTQKNAAAKKALQHFDLHFRVIFQRRNDCIHNCDRPKVAIQGIRLSEVDKRIEDVEFLVSRCHDSFIREFPIYLIAIGCNPATRNQVCI